MGQKPLAEILLLIKLINFCKNNDKLLLSRYKITYHLSWRPRHLQSPTPVNPAAALPRLGGSLKNIENALRLLQGFDLTSHAPQEF